MSIHSRRSFVLSSAALVGSIGAVPLTARGQSPAGAPVDGSFPTQEPEMVREMVAVSHGNIARVKELVGKHQTLAKASWDWGFGDWESALGAASHVGNREIAEFLLANGARPSIFSAAMLGHLDIVKAFVAATPGIQRTKGPHSITLLKHATAGGPRAKPVADYLESVGGADERLSTRPLTTEDIAKLTGKYPIGPTGDPIEITVTKEQLNIGRGTRPVRGLFHLGSLEFCPVGAENVRIRFAENGGVMTLTVHDPDVVVTAKKTT